MMQPQTELTYLTLPNCPPICEVDLKKSRWLNDQSYPIVHLYVSRILHRDLYYRQVNTLTKGSRLPVLIVATVDRAGETIRRFEYRDVAVTSMNNTGPDVTIEFTYKP